VYANDKSEDVFATHEKIPRSDMVCRAATKVRDEVKASPRPELPIIWSEYNATYFNEPKITDTPFMGPWIADTLRRCDGLTDMMSYWTFSDVFEEQGVVRRPFYGGFGLIAAGGIPKPSFNAFKMLHQLGTERLDAESEDVLVTRRPDGSLVIALWNYVPPAQAGSAKTIVLRLPPNAQAARVLRLDEDHGDVTNQYIRMGSPQYPTREQIAALIEASELPPPQELPIVNGRASVTLPPNGLATVRFIPGR
jgi:xylan 1,4-beta-xylosidase